MTGSLNLRYAIIARRIVELEFVTCATPAYLKKHGFPSHPRELVGT